MPLFLSVSFCFVSGSLLLRQLAASKDNHSQRGRATSIHLTTSTAIRGRRILRLIFSLILIVMLAFILLMLLVIIIFLVTFFLLSPRAPPVRCPSRPRAFESIFFFAAIIITWCLDAHFGRIRPVPPDKAIDMPPPVNEFGQERRGRSPSWSDDERQGDEGKGKRKDKGKSNGKGNGKGKDNKDKDQKGKTGKGMMKDNGKNYY